MAGRIILVRHGETEANRAGCFADSDEIPLTDRGRLQARDTARRLAADYLPEHIFSSPFARARETGQVIAQSLQLEVETLEGIHERDFGCLKGHPYRRMGELMDADPSYDRNSISTWRPSGGESLEDVRRRAVAVLEQLQKRHADRDVVLVCHGAVIQAVTAHLTGNWHDAGIPDNGEFIVIEAAILTADT
ncbi:MAG TPA: histidine phosphatase family protein [Bryobacteraceae bacterium]|jgi:broad specificity phosphatase PhoE